MLFRYFILLRIHKNKRNLIKKLKSKNNFNETADEVRSRTQKIFVKNLLKILSSAWISLLSPFIWTGMFTLIVFIIFAIFDFQCSEISFGYMRNTHLVFTAFCYLSVLFLIFMDWIFNIKLIFTCKWKKFLIEDDPYQFKLDMLCTVSMIIPTAIWAFVPMPRLFYAFMTEIIDFIGIFAAGMISLPVTIIMDLIFQYRKKNNRKETIDVAYVMSPKFIDLFIKHCESEWSVENIEFKLDIKKYKSLTSSSEREKLVKIIEDKFLIPNVSELEINAPSGLMIEASKKIECGLLEDSLFDSLEKVVDANLSDVIGRFQFSTMYLNFLKDEENHQKDLGL